MCLNLYFKYYSFKSLYFSYAFIFYFFICTTTANRCGEYGFVCLNNQYYKNCDTKFVRDSEKEVVFKCPEHTVCNERYKRACNATHNKEEAEANNTEVTPEEKATVSSIIETPLPDYKLKNMTAETAKLMENSIKTKASNNVTLNRVKRQFYCPEEGAFLDKHKVNGNNKYFYICYRDPRSKNYRSLPVECPNGMSFDQKSGKCVNSNGKKIIIYKFPHKRKNPAY